MIARVTDQLLRMCIIKQVQNTVEDGKRNGTGEMD